jgi:uncharacterized protein YbjT (DUF2867 family)
MILVFGATGTVASNVVRQLAERGVPARALVHTLDKAASVAAPSIEVVQGDLERPESLDTALVGVEKAYLATSGAAIAREGAFYAAARRAGVRHIVRHSGSFLVGPESTVLFDQWHYQSEQQLERSGAGFTHLRSSFFMQNLLRFALGGTIALPLAEARVNLVDARDIAAVAVAALTEDGHEGKTYLITGPEALTFFEVAAMLTVATGQPFTYVPVPAEAFRHTLIGWGLPEPIAGALAEEYRLIGEGHPAFATTTDTVSRVAGRSAHTLNQFARDFAMALRG